jgi:sensor histidine kinase YesM
VKHGIGKKEDGGTVTIATRETDTAFEVIISDDGVGFDVNAPQKDDGRSHIGMENIRKRLKDMCDADIIIESEIGKGTTSKVIIPKHKKEDMEQ